ncbi:MAG TPA: GNAT family N-acetyltransferase [Solirubrobacteraceae bacterium]|nr:GNAT family N-acetyltransferase [Solirubrobacteraceae bacterium]
MPATTTDGFYARALAFEREGQAAVAARVVDLGWGRAYLQPALPLVYDQNLVWASGDGLDVETAMAEADRVLAGLTHRRLIVDDESAWRELTRPLSGAGWVYETEVVMAHRRPPDRVAGVEAVDEGTLADILPAVEAYVCGQRWGHQAEPRRQLLEHHRRFSAAAGHERCFFVRDGAGDGRVIAYCKLWHRHAVAQIEDVVVLPAARGRGHGRAVVTAALGAAQALEPELLFIVADDQDWPKELYARLGFDPVGRLRIFDRRPAA